MTKKDFMKPLVIEEFSCQREAGIVAARSLEDIRTTLRSYMKKDACLVAWQLHRIVWGRWQEGGIRLADGSDLDALLLEEMRVFNEDEELRLVKKRGKLVGRYVCDAPGSGQEAVDSAAKLWGERTAAADGWATLTDSGRGFRMVVPAEEEAKAYALVTRSYIGYDPQTHQAGYDDIRYKAIVPLEEG